MKTLNDYLAMAYRMEIVKDNDEGGFVASYPDLPGCITCGETVEEAVRNASGSILGAVQAASAPKPAPRAGRAFSAGGHQHEPVLRVPSGEK